MKTGKIIAAILSTSLLSAQLTAYAGSNKFRVDFDRNTGNINVNGKADANEIITIEILNPGKTESDLEGSITSVSGLVTYFEELYADKDGKFENIFNIKGEDGKYLIRLCFVNEDEIYEDELLYITTDSVKQLIDAINDNPSKTEEIIEANKELLGFEDEIYNALKAENVSLSDMYGKISDDAPFADYAALETSVTDKMLLEALNNVDSEELLVGIIEANADFIGISGGSVFGDFMGLTANQKGKVCQLLEKDGYNSVSDIKNDFTEKTIFYVLSSIKEWNNIAVKAESYYNEYKDTVSQLEDIDFDAYDDLKASYKQGAMSYFLKRSSGITTLEDWVDGFNDACEKWEKGNPESKEKNNSSGGSGGGGGSTGGMPNIGSSPAGNANQTKEPNAVYKTGFTDLESVSWAKESILALKDAGVISGKSETVFEPDAAVKREEFVKMIVSAFGFTADGETSEFADTNPDEWYYPYINVAVKNGIVFGDDTGKFGIGNGITRQDMAVIIYRVLELKGINAEKVNDAVVFTDENEISDYAKEAVSSLQQYGIISGMDDGSFAPKSGATRAQSAKMIYGVMKLTWEI